MTPARLRTRALRWLPVLLLALLLPACAPAPGPEVRELLAAEAAPAAGTGELPPVDGWIPVELPDTWGERWPQHDGSVWYRLRWQQRDARPTALLVDHGTFAGSVSVNGVLLARDASLVEPLSRGWLQPGFLLLDAPLLRAGENEVLVRVAGHAAFRPGLAGVQIGEPAALEPVYRWRMFDRLHLHVADLGMRLVLAALFAAIWFSRRRDAVYGWFALAQLAGSVYPLYFLAPSPWPFTDTRVWFAWVCVFWIFSAAAQAMFLLRFAEWRLPRVERAIAYLCVLTLTAAVVAPQWSGLQRDAWVLAGTVLYVGSILWFLWQALRSSETEQKVMAGCLLLPVLASGHDYALLMGWNPHGPWLLSWTSVMTLIGIAFVLSHRFARARRRIEAFNAELQQEVESATARLGETLRREHAAALAHERADERLRLVRDLHDGFGGTLVAAIHRLRQAPAATSTAEIVDVLRRMREDLRLVIDSTAGDGDLAAMLANLRHRADMLLEGIGIAVDWRIEGVDGVHLGGARSLDLLRLLQEALTNAGRHSGARSLQVSVVRGDAGLHVLVRDDGHGLADSGRAVTGTGMASMRLRAARLGGELQVASGPAGTLLQLDFPLLEVDEPPVSGMTSEKSPA